MDLYVAKSCFIAHSEVFKSNRNFFKKFKYWHALMQKYMYIPYIKYVCTYTMQIIRFYLAKRTFLKVSFENNQIYEMLQSQS